jgi:large subunit ribosomal protein L32
MVVRMRVNRSKTGRRRSHHALVAAGIQTCACGTLRLPHRACKGCGKYGGKVIVDVVARAKREALRNKRRESVLRSMGQNTKESKVSKKEESTA